MPSLSTFLCNYLGRANVGDTDENRGECVGLVQCWLDELQTPHIWGNAKDLLANADVKAYRVYHNLPSNYPVPGDVIVWDEHMGGGYGHCAVVVAANIHYVGFLEQNNPEGNGCRLSTSTYVHVLGWLHAPRVEW